MLLQTYSPLLGTLANRNCLLIIATLREGESNVTRIIERTHLPQSCVSHCLARLSRDGFVVARREGKFRIYSICAQTIEQLITLLNEHAHTAGMKKRRTRS